MVNTRCFQLPVLALFCLVALPASSALAAQKGSALPTITSVGPLKVAVGDTLTIRGHNFLAGRKRNTVSFKRAGAAAVSVKAGDATSTQLKVVVPAALAKRLSVKGGVARATRFGVRVRARGSSKGYTVLKRSVLVGPERGLDGSPDCAAVQLALHEADALGGALSSAVADALDKLAAQCDDAEYDPGAAADDSVDPADDAPDTRDDSPDIADLLGTTDTTLG